METITDMRIGRNKASNLDAKFPGVYDGNHKHADFSKFTHLYLVRIPSTGKLTVLKECLK